MARIPDDRSDDHDDNTTLPGSKRAEPSTGGRKASLTRRNFLRYSAAAAAVGAAGAGGASATERLGVEFERTIDAGNFDVDPTGETPIDGFLSAHLDGSTAIEFPPGTYLITEYQNVPAGTLGIVGTGEDHRDVRFRSKVGGPDGNDDRWIRFSGDEVALSNFSIDIRGDNRTATDMWLRGVSGTIRDVEFLGRVPPEWNYGRRQLMAVSTESESDVLDVDGLYVRGGAERVDYPNGLGGLRISPGHAGEVIVRNSHFEGLNSSPIRNTKGTGVVTLKNTFFANNANTNIRVQPGNHPTKTTTVENCTVLIDGDLSRLPYSREGDVFGAAGQPSTAIQLESHHNYGGTVYRDVDVVVTYDHPAGARLFRTGGGFGKAEGRTEFRNCRFENPAGEAWTVAMTHGGPFVFENCEFAGSGTVGGGSNVRLRDSTVEESISVEASASGLDRVGHIEWDDPVGAPPNTLTIVGGPRKADYEFSVAGDLQRSGEGLATIDDHDAVDGGTVDGGTVDGYVWGGTDRYHFSGRLADLAVRDDRAAVYLNGEALDPEPL